MRKVLLLLLAISVSVLARPAKIQSFLDGRPLMLEQPFVMLDGQLMAPMRGLSESLGAVVHFDPVTRTIRALRGGREVQLSIGSGVALVNGGQVALGAPAREIKGTTMVPLRFFSEALGAGVQWIPGTQSVAITTPANPPALQSVTHLIRGDRLIVTAIGEPNGQATLELNGGQFPMTEVTPGSYRGETLAQAGTVSVRLVKNGQEVVQTASQPVTVEVRKAVPVVVAPTFDLLPKQGSTVETPRPLVRVITGPTLQPATARLLVDGQEVTVKREGNLLSFEPAADLAPGEHQAQILVKDLAGREQSQQWSFRVQPQVTGAVGERQSIDVTLLNVRPGDRVGDIFDLEGQTVPHATVTVNVDMTGPAGSGLTPAKPRRVLTTQARADDSGHFVILIDASAVPREVPIALGVQAADPLGQRGPIRTVEVIRD